MLPPKRRHRNCSHIKSLNWSLKKDIKIAPSKKKKKPTKVTLKRLSKLLSQEIHYYDIYILSIFCRKSSEEIYRSSVIYSLFWEEISACVSVHTCYVMGMCDCVLSIIFLPHMVGTSFVLAALSEPKHYVTWSHRAGVNFPFLKGKTIQYFRVSA